MQSYYRQMRLVAEHFGRDPQGLSQKSVQGYILHLKSDRGWSASSLRQAIAAMRMFHCEMLGKTWKLWDVVKVRDGKRLPVVLDIEQVGGVLKSVALLRHRVPLRLIYCCGLRLDEACNLTVDDIEPGAVIVRDGKGGKERRVDAAGRDGLCPDQVAQAVAQRLAPLRERLRADAAFGRAHGQGVAAEGVP